jgi:hypothetical protein
MSTSVGGRSGGLHGSSWTQAGCSAANSEYATGRTLQQPVGKREEAELLGWGRPSLGWSPRFWQKVLAVRTRFPYSYGCDAPVGDGWFKTHAPRPNSAALEGGTMPAGDEPPTAPVAGNASRGASHRRMAAIEDGRESLIAWRASRFAFGGKPSLAPASSALQKSVVQRVDNSCERGIFTG